MNVMHAVICFGSVPLLFACAPGNPGPATSIATTPDQALQQCRYQAQVATVTPGALPEGGISRSLNDRVTTGAEQADLIGSCLKTKGFQRG